MGATTPSPDGFVSATRAETRAVFDVGLCGLLAFGAIAGVGSLLLAAEFSHAPRVLTPDFVVCNFAGAFRWPAYLIAVYCGGRIAYRDSGSAAVTVASKVSALCIVVLAVMTAFGIAAIGMQIALGVRPLQPGLGVYAIYINFGWHIFVLAAVSLAVQVVVRDAIRACPALALKTRSFGMAIAVGMVFVACALGEESTPFGPLPAPHSGMNGYSHYLERFYPSGVFWTASAMLLLLAAHAWICRDGLRRGRWRLTQGIVNVGAPTVVMWIAAGCWMYVLDPDTNDAASRASASDDPGQDRFDARRGRLSVVALDLAVDIYPVERRLESRGSMLLANAGAEPIGELALTFPTAARVDRVDIPSVVEHVDSGIHRYVFARPLRLGERVRMGFELAWEQRGSGYGRNARRLVENGSFVEGADVVPSFADGPAWQGSEAEPTRMRAVIGTSLDQVAVGPGVLLREWKENARRYFEYARGATAADAPPSTAAGAVWPAFSIHSARYAVARDRWNDMTVEVYYHPDHERNVGAMFGCVRQSLGRPGRWSLYPDRLLRVIEFPYAGAARVFPDAIAFSEQREFAFHPRAVDALCDSVAGAIARQHDGAFEVRT